MTLSLDYQSSTPLNGYLGSRHPLELVINDIWSREDLFHREIDQSTSYHSLFLCGTLHEGLSGV